MKRPVRSGVFLLLLASVFAPAATAQAIGACHATEVPGPIILPDGSIEGSGRLEICLSRMYSPVAGFHRTAIDGRVSGLFVSRKITADASGDDERPKFTFLKLADGSYELESYVLTEAGRTVTFEMRPGRVRSRWQLQRASLDPELDDPSVTMTGF